MGKPEYEMGPSGQLWFPQTPSSLTPAPYSTLTPHENLITIFLSR